MARIIDNKFPIDLTPSVAVGYGFPLDGPAVFVPTFTTREQTRANLVNYLLTNKGERVFNPLFGGDLRSLLFEGIISTTQEELLLMLQDQIGQFFPTVRVEEIRFNNDEDRNTINFILTYQIVNFGVTDTLNIELQ
jgi:phage baseplate assembly protein W|tara:strand:- start:351 stop:758 length:408 start_codon:yes stop_codon:yes gene_type:complete